LGNDRDTHPQENEMNLSARTSFTLAIALLTTPAFIVRAQDAPKPLKAATGEGRTELFLGYSRFGGGSSSTSLNRMVGLNGGSAAFAYNFNRSFAVVADFGGYDDSQLLLTGTGLNQPLLVNSSGTAYSYLFGPRVSFHRGSRISPFAQVLAGGVHASAVTVTNCAGTACTPLPVQNTFALTAGGGLDFRLTHHIFLRAVQAEYMMTRFGSTPNNPTSGNQNDYRLSSGLVFRFGGSEARLPLELACSIQPGTVFPGDPLAITATPSHLNPHRTAVYSWTTSGGAISGSGAMATVSTMGIAAGNYTVTGTVSEGPRTEQKAQCSASFTVQSSAPPTISCSANPSTVQSGTSSAITAQASSPQHHALTYSFVSTAGRMTSATSTAVLNTEGVAPGPIAITCTVVDDLGKSASADTSVTVLAPAPLPVAALPQTRDLCSLSFERDRKRPARVDNEAKACLDDIALQMQREPEGRIAIVGSYSDDEKPAMGAQRATNVRLYLVNEKGIDSQRVDLRLGTASGRTVKDVFVPNGATFNNDGSTMIDTTIDRH